MTPSKLQLALWVLATIACAPPPAGGSGDATSSGDDTGESGESGDDNTVAGMVEIPAGEFWRGCEEEQVFELFGVGCSVGPDFVVQDVPYRELHLSRYWVDQYEATIGEYVACVDAGVCEPVATIAPPDLEPRDRIAIGGINWFQAVAYCEWRGKRLPTEAEWEKAGRGTDARELPWGDSAGPEACGYANTRLNYPEGCAEHVVQVNLVDAYPMDRSAYGVVGMAGNLQEWVNDWAHYDYYAVAPDTDPPGPETSSAPLPMRIVRGGYYDALMRLSLRRWIQPSHNVYRVGVRCASSADPGTIDDPLATP